MYTLVVMVMLSVSCNCARAEEEDDEEFAIVDEDEMAKRALKDDHTWIEGVRQRNLESLGTYCDENRKCPTKFCNLKRKQCCAPHGYLCNNDTDCCSEGMVCAGPFTNVCRAP